jgi:O-antigen/teichoic acid export membrane protein
LGNRAGRITALTAVMFGAAMAAWVVEEAFRRLMMACFMFRSLAINDAVYGLVAIGTALALVATTGITLTGLVFAMLCGSSASIAVGMIQVPLAEWWPKTSAVSDWSALSRIAVWRSGQLSMRPATLLAVRVGVEAVSSAAVLGLFEAGRLVVAAVMTLANGLGAFALPYFKRRFDRGELTPGFAARSVRLAFIAGLAALPSMAVMVPLVGVADDGSTLPVALIGSWALLAVLSCANAVAVNALAVWGRNRELFLARVVDAAVAVPLSLVFAARGWVEWLPCCLAAGMVIGTGGLFGLASRQRPNSSRPETQIDLRRPVEAADAFDSSGIGAADDIKDPGHTVVSPELGDSGDSVDSVDLGDSTERGGVGERRS